MKQREAVYQAVVSVLESNGIEFIQGKSNAAQLLTKEMRSEVHRIVVAGFESGTVKLKETQSNHDKLTDSAKLSSYVTGLITNWLNKDPDLNGGLAYQSKNPGSRAGSGDTLVKEMRLLKKQLEAAGNLDGVAKVEEAIEDRVKELKAAKAKANKPEAINVDNLPDFLKDLVF